MTSPVVILFGGSSSERRVSVASGQNVSRLLPEAAAWFLSPGGGVHEVTRERLAAHERPFERDFEPGVPARAPSLVAALDGGGLADTAFVLALHGGEGENGGLQAELERRRLAFTGSGSVASALAFDKVKTRERVGERGVALAGARLLGAMTREEAQRALTLLLVDAPRWVLKPVADGSSFGLVQLKGPADIASGAEQVAALQVRYLAEEFVEGRELTVGVVDEPQGTTPLPVSEVRLAADTTFDFEGKYLGRGTEEITPAQLTLDERAQAQALGVLAHQAVGCEGYSRTDLILSGRGQVFLEINTLPGLTKASFIPQQLAAAGKDFRQFLEWQIEFGRDRNGRSR